MTGYRLSRTLTTPEDLVEAGFVAPARRRETAAVAARYALAVTSAVASLIDPADPADPIARQYLPDARELIRDPAEEADPIGDDLKSPLKGLVHRYRDRVLIKLVAVCAVYCRFCFRRETIGPGARALSEADFAAALAYIRARPEIWEAVLTGGDPLVLSPRRLAATTRALAAIPHLKVMRWHSRLPVVAPERVTKAMARALSADHDKAVYVALHVNHPRELTPEARAACRRLIEGGATLVSQSVLLKGVNDDAHTLEALMRALVEARVKPYYLHHGDLAPGTAHFRVPIAKGQALMSELRRRLSGLAMPTYVLDIPGAHGKTPIGPSAIFAEGDGGWRIVDAAGESHIYRDILRG
ncbi:MAG: lysine-2,3-aminomutase-like protein [Bradyrhizobium sp.]|nr:MAG: lysine-2,3-aminomutase-like protein [Bradyrhizobium sp.]